MNDWPYHQYLFFDLGSGFHRLRQMERDQLLHDFAAWLAAPPNVSVVTYATLGFKPDTTFMLWARAHDPSAIQTAVRDLLRSQMGEWLTLRQSLFGITRPSQYSRGPQKADQVILANERLPYLIIYPFTKTTDWYQLDFETRRQLMGAHIKVGVGHPAIRQCLLYSYGVDDHEFIVSYETPTLEQFQDLIIELRSTEVRKYTANDLPIYTCIYKSPKEPIEWL
jgi:chlorite dismutase